MSNALGRYVQYKVSDTLKDSFPKYHGMQAYLPVMETIWKLHSDQPGQWFGSKYRINEYRDFDIPGCDDDSDSEAEPNATIELNTTEGDKDTQDVFCHCKVAHLLNPIHFLEGRYSFPTLNKLPWHDKPYKSAIQKLQSPFNQAYVDALGMYLTSRLVEDNKSPHFLPYYGSVTAIADEYIYNITDDYPSYRNESWFWQALKKKKVPFRITNQYEPQVAVPDEVVAAITTPPANCDLFGDGDNVSINSDEENLLDVRRSAEVVETPDDIGQVEEAESIKTASDNESDNQSDNETDDEDCSDNESTSSEVQIGLEFKEMPVLLSFQKEADGVMDDLFFDEEEVGAKAGTAAWEARWTAWIFQVTVALAQMQSAFNMTHNDLHTNNVVWTETKDEYLFYKSAQGEFYKVPTFGKIFHIIDFGRAIFRVGHRQWISDDYIGDNDAAGQYNFGPIYNPRKPKVVPNMSFDLTRFAVSCLEEIFPDQPTKKKRSPTKLSEEPGRTMWETTSPLFNMLWNWLLTDKGENVLWDADDEDRYPDFRLYEVIARSCFNAVPSEQLTKAPFAAFRCDAAAVTEGTKVYDI
jgi:hypothetical protein